jgi:hypothetical protein
VRKSGVTIVWIERHENVLSATDCLSLCTRAGCWRRQTAGHHQPPEVRRSPRPDTGAGAPGGRGAVCLPRRAARHLRYRLACIHEGDAWQSEPPRSGKSTRSSHRRHDESRAARALRGRVELGAALIA